MYILKNLLNKVPSLHLCSIDHHIVSGLWTAANLMQPCPAQQLLLFFTGNGNFNPSATPVGQGYFINVVSFPHSNSLMLLP